MPFNDCDVVKIRLVFMDYPDQHHPIMDIYVRLTYSSETINRYKLLYGGNIRQSYHFETDDPVIQQMICQSLDDRDIYQIGTPSNSGTISLISTYTFEKLINLKVKCKSLKEHFFHDDLDENLLRLSTENIESHVSVLEYHKNRIEHTLSLLNEEIDELNKL